MNINQKLHEAYCAADYAIIVGADEHIVHVGQPSEVVDLLLNKHQCKSAAFITAYNPGSQKRAVEINEKDQQRFVDEIVGNGYPYYKSEGRGHNDDWPVEPGLIVMGISQKEAATIAGAYGQIAYLWFSAGLEVALCYV